MINREKQLMFYVEQGEVELAYDYFLDNYSTNSYARLSSNNMVRSLKNNGIVLCTLLTRAALRGGIEESNAYTLSDNFILSIEGLDAKDKIALLMCDMVRTFTEKVNEAKFDDTSIVLKKTLQYINSNYDRNITLNDISDDLKLSRNYISTLFNREMRKGFSLYLNQVRIEHSLHLLLNTTLTLSEISIKCGFSNASYFSKIFKQITKETPYQYKLLQKNN